MALIGTLRTKMTKVVVGLVAISMIFFIVGTDLFGNGPRSIFGGSKNNVGEIAGHSISLEEYQGMIQDRENNYIMSMGRKPGEREEPQLRQEAWEMLILKYAITPQFEKVGVKVTSDEEWDMVQGKNMDQNIKTNFSDSSGNFNRSRLMEFLKGLNNPEMAQYKVRWDVFRASLVPGRERLKYEYLMVKTNYITEAEAERDYHNQNDVIEARYLYVPYFAVSDSTVTPSESDLKTYYNNHKEKYKVEKSRSLSYVTFPVVPSPKDSATLMDDLAKTLQNFKNTADDSVFANNNSEGKDAFAKYSISTLPPFLRDKKESLKTGVIIGPELEGNTYKIVKVVKVGTDTVYSAKASHILIKWDQDTPEGKKAAKEKARKILKDIQGGANFAAKALEFGTDGTKTRGGDLGWFSTGSMVKPFQEAVFAAKRTGVLSDVVETQYGYHIIDVTGLKDNASYTIANIEREITPSDETHNEVYRRAESFASGIDGVDEFKAKAKQENLGVFDANDVATTERRINNLGDARRIVTWLFRDETSTGKVSEVFELNDNYVIAVMSGETEEGYRPLEKVKEEITLAVKNELKSKIMIEKLSNLKGSLEEMAKIYGSDAAVNSISDLKLNTSSIGSIGFDPVAVGVAFSLESGKRSKPFAGENGVVVLEIQNKTVAPSVADYSMFKTQTLQTLNNRVSYNIPEAIKKAADIKDKRYKFF